MQVRQKSQNQKWKNKTGATYSISFRMGTLQEKKEWNAYVKWMDKDWQIKIATEKVPICN